MNRVTFALMRKADGKYWTSSAWGAATGLSARISGTTWIYTTGLPSGANLANGTYHVTVYAYDNASNLGKAESDFTKIASDTSGPAVTYAAPTNGSTATTLAAVRGNANDGATGTGISRVITYLSRKSDGKYWTGTAWGAAVALPTTLAPVSATAANWTVSAALPSGANLPSGSYHLATLAYDNAGLNTRADIDFTIGTAAVGTKSPVTTPTPTATPAPTPTATPAPSSSIVLSTASAASSPAKVRLIFTGAVAAGSTDPARYSVEVGA